MQVQCHEFLLNELSTYLNGLKYQFMKSRDYNNFLCLAQQCHNRNTAHFACWVKEAQKEIYFLPSDDRNRQVQKKEDSSEKHAIASCNFNLRLSIHGMKTVSILFSLSLSLSLTLTQLWETVPLAFNCCTYYQFHGLPLTWIINCWNLGMYQVLFAGLAESIFFQTYYFTKGGCRRISNSPSSLSME
jgi:hypothetical protein